MQTDLLSVEHALKGLTLFFPPLADIEGPEKTQALSKRVVPVPEKSSESLVMSEASGRICNAGFLCTGLQKS